ncbi:serine/threonine protein kinase, partial [bacterium]|nr:serine/threonine protein kinase [bacterium]
MARVGRMVGQKVDRYRFQQLIGKGSSSEVYRAHDMRLYRDV